jgi:P-type Ca2+ transporter type 2C
MDQSGPIRDISERSTESLGIHAIWVGLLMAAVTLSLQAWATRIGDSHWQTMVFTVLCLSQLGHVMAIRSERESLFSQGIFTNKPLFYAVLGTVILQLTIVYAPVSKVLFKTQPLTSAELAVTLFLSSIVFVAVEADKMIKRKELHS